MQPRGGEIPTPDDLAPLTTPGCIVKVKQVSLAFECSAEPTHAGLLLINDQVFLAFACLERESMLIAARRMLDRDRAELERRRIAGRGPASGTLRCRSSPFERARPRTASSLGSRVGKPRRVEVTL